jgi:hypothetical protein
MEGATITFGIHLLRESCGSAFPIASEHGDALISLLLDASDEASAG